MTEPGTSWRRPAVRSRGVARIGPVAGDREVGASAASTGVGGETGPGRPRQPGIGRLGRERALSATVLGFTGPPRVVAFVSGKGGVGTTSTAAAVAATLAVLVPGTVALADVHSGAASLAQRLGGVPGTDATTFATGTVDPARAAGVAVVDGTPWDTPLLRPALVRLVMDLREDHRYTLLDIGDDASDVGHAALARADRVVVVTTGAADAVAATVRTLDRLRGIDPDRAETATVVVVGARRFGRREGTGRPILPVARERIVMVPWDPALRDGALIDLERLRRSSRAAYLTVAAAVSADQPQSGDPARG
ncbi:hypothetical protein GCM10027290_64850 [Micromonospora sonneratiae]